jgi:ADP-ribosylglycohydrolase
LVNGVVAARRGCRRWVVQAKERHEIRSSGYVIDTLEAALWAFYNSTTFQEGAVLAVNLANDADTVGAVYGQIAGTYYGEQAIPAAWLKQLAWRHEIAGLADGLLERAG